MCLLFFLSASCLNEETYPPILIAAVALSFILILLGVVMLGGFVIAFQLKCKCLTIKDTKVCNVYTTNSYYSKYFSNTFLTVISK